MAELCHALERAEATAAAAVDPTSASLPDIMLKVFSPCASSIWVAVGRALPAECCALVFTVAEKHRQTVVKEYAKHLQANVGEFGAVQRG